jgi:hypothetical protein
MATDARFRHTLKSLLAALGSPETSRSERCSCATITAAGHTVTVAPEGFVWEGKPYSSLSAAIGRSAAGGERIRTSELQKRRPSNCRVGCDGAAAAARRPLHANFDLVVLRARDSLVWPVCARAAPRSRAKPRCPRACMTGGTRTHRAITEADGTARSHPFGA